MDQNFKFEIEKKIQGGLGRAGFLHAPHGVIQTPAFVTVGTKGTVKSLTPEQIKESLSQVVLANTYHLYLQPGEKIIKNSGGLHGFMNWQGPTMTDSGGFQAFSLGIAYGQGIGKFINADAPEVEVLEEGLSGTNKKAKVTEEGVEFKSIIDGSTHFLSPEKSIQIQNDIGADIIFALDEFTSPHADFEKIKETIERTQRWAERCLVENGKNNLTPNPLPQGKGAPHFYHTTDTKTWRALQESVMEMRKNPTPSENFLWESLRKNSIGFHFRRQHIIDRFIVDFLCLEKLLVIEVDGGIHDYQKTKDKERQKFLEQKGFRVIRFRNEEILEDINSVVSKIQNVLGTLPLGGRVGDGVSEALSLGEGLGGVKQALFGIVQGGRYEELRKMSAESISKLRFDGFGIGGTFIKEDMATAVRWVNEILPEQKPRHLLGVGEPLDLFLAVENGCDTFDCVAATRMARNGTLYTKNGKININNAKYSGNLSKIEETCNCYTCKNYTAGYVSHLFRAKEMLAATLATIHNLYFINSIVAEMRQAILEDRFDSLKQEFFATYKG